MPDAERMEALMALLTTTDMFDGQRRHVLKIDGKPERFEVWRYLPMAYVVQSRVDREGERG